MSSISSHGHVLGWRRTTNPARFPLYAASRDTIRKIPPHTDLRFGSPAVYDQGPIGSCTGASIGGAAHFLLIKQRTEVFQPSRLFIYFNERWRERTIPIDSGASLSDGIWTLQQYGICPETQWPYIPTPADRITNAFPAHSAPVIQPSQAAYDHASMHKQLSGFRVQQTLAQLRGCLADGYPIVFGFTMYSSFYDVRGMPATHIPLPSSDDTEEGGHAVCIWGHDDDRREFLCRNSWGTGVQENGYYYMPFSYVTEPDLAADFHTIRKISV